MSFQVTFNDIVERLRRDMAVAARDYPAFDRAGRGDHDLNPGLDDMVSGATDPSDLKHAAVLVPLVNRREGPTVLLTKRTSHLRDHAGQISFPGGRVENHDESAVAAAIRETEEETGLSADRIEILGCLDPYRTRTGFFVEPIVGAVSPPFDIDPDPFEVEEVFEVPLAFFLDRANHKKHFRMHEGVRRQFYAMPYGDYYIWGATAGMLVNLVDVLHTDLSLGANPIEGRGVS